MNSTRFLLLTLILTGSVAAQNTAGEQPPKTGEKPAEKKPAETSQDKKPSQDPRLDSTLQLKKSLEVAKSERQFLERVVSSGGLLHRFKKNRELAMEMTKSFTPEIQGPALPTKQAARLLGDGEKQKLSKDVVFTVEGVPVTQAEYDATVKYLNSYPRADSTVAVESLAIASLVQRKAGQGAFAGKAKVARQIMDEIARRLKEGQKFADLVGQYSNDTATNKVGGKRGELVRAEMDHGYAMAAFHTRVGEISDVVASRDGYHILRVLSVKKGDSPDKDRVKTAHIVRYYTTDVESRAQMARRIAEGKVDLAFRTDELRKLAPSQFK